MSERILVFGDLHAGAIPGLTPPGYWRKDLEPLQKILWDFFVSVRKTRGPFDGALLTGDLIDGPGVKGDTVGHLTTKIDTQAEIAAEAIAEMKVKPSRILSAYGTPVHVSGSFDYENLVMEKLGAPAPRDMVYLQHRGLHIGVRHVAGTSSIPYGQGTPMLRDTVADQLEALNSGQEACDLILNGHAHYSAEAKIGNRAGIIVPCLKYPVSVYGRKLRSTYYHMGMGILVIDGQRSWTFEPILLDAKIVKRRDWVCLK